MMRKFIYLLAIAVLLLTSGCSNHRAAEEIITPTPVISPKVQQPEPPSVPSVQPSPEQVSESTPSTSPTSFPAFHPDIQTENITQPEQTPSPEPSPEPTPLPTPEPTTEDDTEPEAPPTPAPSASTILPVLMYHHVVPDGTVCNDMTVTVSKLDQDLQWMKDHGYEPILPRDLIFGSPLPEKPILITFDDGYLSNYELAYPLFQKHQAKAVISIIVCTQGSESETWLSWDMCREMSDSGLIEIGSHTFCLHNFDERGGNFTYGGINGIQRYPDEPDTDFQNRVLNDLQKSHDLIEQELGCEATFFAYPFGMHEPDAEPLIQELFPVTVLTRPGHADLSNGTRDMPRWTITMETDLSSVLGT